MGLGPQHTLPEQMPTVKLHRRPRPPLPQLARLDRLDTSVEYVLPHAAPLPPPPAPISRVQPAGDRFVESVINNTIPALEPWPGVHGFRVTVRTPRSPLGVRQPPYVFDAESNKLYVDMSIAVTVAFRVTSGTDTGRLRVSALPVYPDMHHVNTPVRRCPTHRQPEVECNVGAESHIDHVIRAEHDDAIYQEMGTTKERRSVVVPFEPPPPGTEEYRVAYKFCCMNTCVGGINRRRLMVLFTLEDSSTGEALGRQSFEVKVCKCPHRDARVDRTRRRATGGPPVAPGQRKRHLEQASEGGEPPVRRPRPAGRLTIEVQDMDEFDHLTAVLESFRAVRRRRLARSAPDTPALPPAPVAVEPAEDERETAEVAPPDMRRRPTLPVFKTELL